MLSSRIGGSKTIRSRGGGSSSRSRTRSRTKLLFTVVVVVVISSSKTEVIANLVATFIFRLALRICFIISCYVLLGLHCGPF